MCVCMYHQQEGARNIRLVGYVKGLLPLSDSKNMSSAFLRGNNVCRDGWVRSFFVPFVVTMPGYAHATAHALGNLIRAQPI